MLSIRRLGAGDAAILATLARDAADFDMEDRMGALEELDQHSAEQYLRNPDILHWIAEQDGRVAGFLLCYVQYKWHAPARELMLYDIGVRESARRGGVGRALMATMETWMWENGVQDVWVLADNPGAEEFYRACGFTPDGAQAVGMSKRVR